MKRHAISTVAILVVLAVVLVSFGQEERARRRRMGREERLKAIEVIEAQLAKLKESPAFSREGFQNFRNMSEDEQAKFIERMTKALQEQRKIYQTIMGQLASLQGRREPAPEGAQYLIISTADLKPIQETATKEKAKETSQLLERLIARGSSRGFGRRRGPQGDQGSQRSTDQEQ
ncbi:MAG: HMG-box domain-containing protein [Planctomycetota bacterium]|jgi:hypothetical protein